MSWPTPSALPPHIGQPPAAPAPQRQPPATPAPQRQPPATPAKQQPHQPLTAKIPAPPAAMVVLVDTLTFTLPIYICIQQINLLACELRD